MAKARPRSAPAKAIKLFAGLLLFPLCLGATRTAIWVIQVTATTDSFWIPFLTGGACWLAIYVFLPKPLWLYVCGHELTHALWTKLFGGKVKSIKISAHGGSVAITKTNFLISLSPYFFPLYAVLIMIVFVVGDRIWGLKHWIPLLYLLLGAAYAFHVTLTGHALKTEQTDISDQGRLFSLVVIWLGNVGMLIICVPILTSKITVWTALSRLPADTFMVIHLIFHSIF